jgi:multisubunit Na+/H+ antiporter MnhC subunit
VGNVPFGDHSMFASLVRLILADCCSIRLNFTALPCSATIFLFALSLLCVICVKKARGKLAHVPILMGRGSMSAAALATVQNALFAAVVAVVAVVVVVAVEAVVVVEAVEAAEEEEEDVEDVEDVEEASSQEGRAG